MINFPFTLLFVAMGILTWSAQFRELPRGVSFGVISVGGVPETSFVGLGYLIPKRYFVMALLMMILA
jgi:hypothetical protein